MEKIESHGFRCASTIRHECNTVVCAAEILFCHCQLSVMLELLPLDIGVEQTIRAIERLRKLTQCLDG